MVAFTLDTADPKVIAFPDGAFVAACSAAIQIVPLTLSRRLALAMAFNIFFFGSLLHVVDPLPDKTFWEHVYFSGITYLTVGYGDLALHSPLARLISVVCAAAGIGTFGMLIASVTKKIMYR